MTLYSPSNLPLGFVTLENVWQRYIHAHDEEDAEGWLRAFHRRSAVKAFALDLAEELDAEANGSWIVRGSTGGRFAIFVPPMQGGV